LPTKTIIPEVLRPRDYPGDGRVFLSFYVRVFDWDVDEAGSVVLTIIVDDYPEFRGEFAKPGWHPCLVDLRPWGGEEVRFSFKV